jgi:hypothetical protein
MMASGSYVNGTQDDDEGAPGGTVYKVYGMLLPLPPLLTRATATAARHGAARTRANGDGSPHDHQLQHALLIIAMRFRRGEGMMG